MTYTENIKLTGIKPEELSAVVSRLERFIELMQNTPCMNTRATLSVLSILHEVSKKLQKKYIDKKEKNEFSFSLKYYEAATLWDMLYNVELDFDTQQIMNQLDQKLA